MGKRDWVKEVVSDFYLLIRAILQSFGDQNIGLIAAGVAFYGMLALFPSLAAVVAIWSLLADPVQVANQLQVLEEVMPPQGFAIIERQVNTLVAADRNLALGWASALSILTSMWFSRAGVASLIRGLDAINGTAAARNPVTYALTGLWLTAVLMGVGLVAIGGVVFGPPILALVPLPQGLELGLATLRWAFAILAVLIGLGVLYRWGPARPVVKTGWLSTGAIAAMILWIIFSATLAAYLRNFGSYNEIYGSIGAVIALQLWFLLSAYAVLIGALVNVERAKLSGRADTPGKEGEPQASQGRARESGSG
ncbi:MAG: YihY/virulence factor BrkB family protein [Rubricella sp.]